MFSKGRRVEWTVIIDIGTVAYRCRVCVQKAEGVEWTVIIDRETVAYRCRVCVQKAEGVEWSGQLLLT